MLKVLQIAQAYGADAAYKKDFRFNQNGKLYKVLQDHTSQAGWKPESTPSLYAEVEKPGEGDTPDNPIAYNGNMALIMWFTRSSNGFYSQSESWSCRTSDYTEPHTS